MNLIYCQQINIWVERGKKKPKPKKDKNSAYLPHILQSPYPQAQVYSLTPNLSAHALGMKVHDQRNFSATPLSSHFPPLLVEVPLQSIVLQHMDVLPQLLSLS